MENVAGCSCLGLLADNDVMEVYRRTLLFQGHGDLRIRATLISQDISERLGLSFMTEALGAEVMLCAYEQSGLFPSRAGVDYG